MDTHKRTALRELYYGKLMQFASDVYKVPAEKLDGIDEPHKLKLAKL